MYATMEETTILVFNKKKRKSEKENWKEATYVKHRLFSHSKKKEEQTRKKAHLTVLR